MPVILRNVWMVIALPFLLGIQLKGKGQVITLSPSPNQATGSNVSLTITNPVSGSLFINHQWPNHSLATYTTSGNQWICLPDNLKHVLRRCDKVNGVTMFFNVQSNFSSLFFASAQVNFNVSDCNTKISGYGPNVNATSFTYNKPGQFVCPAGQELFYSNSTSGITNTICQNDATWYGAKGLECWSAPPVKLEGTFAGVDKSYINLTCTFDETVWPAGNECNITLNYVFEKTALANQQFQLYLTRDMNGKTIAAQAITKYTKQRPNQGISSQQPLQVYYPPSISGIRANESSIYANQYVLLQNTNITLTCDVDSNPNSTCSWSYDNFNGSKACSVTRKFNISTNATCTAYNGVGKPATKSVTIISVPVNRQPQILVNGVTLDQNATQPLNLSSNLNLSCSVDFENYLNTSFIWMKGDVTVSKTSNLSINNATQNNTGAYECKSSDEFGKFQSSVYVDVRFKPYKGKTAGCTENQQCDIEVVSNPAPGNPFLVAPAMGSFTWTVQNHPYYTFQITKPKGTYMFRVNNSVGEGMFNVTVVAKTPISTSNLALIIGASVAGVLVIAFVIILIVVIRRRNAGKSEQEERQNPIYGSSPNAVDNGTDYAQVQKKNKKNKKEMTENIAYQPASSPDAIEDAYASVSKNEKEVKMNILYGSSTGAHTSQVEDAYAEVDKGKKKKKDKTKAMKVNVAYVPTPENPDAPEEAYAEVNKDKKKKGKKGEKEMKDNILYGSSQAGGSVEDAYAEVDKKKKKNAGAKQGEAGSGATYSEVSKPKNKKKDKPSSSQTPDDDPYAEVDLHGQED